MSTSKHLRNEITEGVIWKQLLLFFFPILLGTFFQQLYNTIDAIVVGRFVGSNALAAVGGSSGQILNLIVGFFVGLSSGATVTISQFMGSGDRQKVNEGIHTLYAFSVIGSVVITVIGIVLAPWLLTIMKTPAEQYADSLLYLRIYFAGVFFVFIYNTGAAILRALGDSRRPLVYLIICCFVNVALDLILVVGCGLGVAGVAIATLAAQAVSAVLVTVALMRSPTLCDFTLQGIRIYGSSLKMQLYIGLPGGVQGSMYSLSNLILQTAVNSIGAAAAAGWTAMGKLDAVYWMVGGSLGISVTTFVGQNYGAGLMDRVKKSVRIGLGLSIGFAVLASTLLVGFRYPLLSIFTSETEVLEVAAGTMAIIAPFYVLFTFIEIYSSALRGMGDVIIPMIMTMLGVCGFRIAWVFFVVPLEPSMATISSNYPISWGITALFFIVYYGVKMRRLGKKLGN